MLRLNIIAKNVTEMMGIIGAGYQMLKQFLFPLVDPLRLQLVPTDSLMRKLAVLRRQMDIAISVV